MGGDGSWDNLRKRKKALQFSERHHIQAPGDGARTVALIAATTRSP